MNFRFIENARFEDFARPLFDILFDNMSSVTPFESSRETEFQAWRDAVGEGMKSPKRHIVLIESNNEAIGFFQYYTNNEVFCMEEIQIKPEHRSGEAFRALYGFVLERLPKRIRRVVAFADKRNEKSISVLKHLGLEICGKINENLYRLEGSFKALRNWFYKDEIMTANEIFQKVLERANCIRTETCDGLIFGDESKTVNKVGVCFKLTVDVIRKAVEKSVDMIITHEPSFGAWDNIEGVFGYDIKKLELLKQSGITVYRYHDHCHDSTPDYIHEGFIRTVGLNIEKSYERDWLGISKYDLKEPITARELGLLIKEKLSLDAVRTVGNIDFPVKSIYLGLGSVGVKHVDFLREPGGDLFISGEIFEVCDLEYIRDACALGENKAVLLFGHYGAEYAGMRYFAEELNESLIETVYLDSGEVFGVLK